jgi:hypothetical protein
MNNSKSLLLKFVAERNPVRDSLHPSPSLVLEAGIKGTVFRNKRRGIANTKQGYAFWRFSDFVQECAT